MVSRLACSRVARLELLIDGWATLGSMLGRQTHHQPSHSGQTIPCLQNPEEEQGIMGGLRRAAAAVQASEFAKAHERVLDQPGSTPVEVLQQLKQAAKVTSRTYTVVIIYGVNRQVLRMM